MHLDKYDYITNSSFATFEFESDGPKGKIKKLIYYKQIDTLSNGVPVFNLSFGDWDESLRNINDLSISNNKDRDKILITVASTVIVFTDHYGKIPIIAAGSTPVRTRLYQMSINSHKKLIARDFNIFGLTIQGWEKFESGVNYTAFLVIRK